VRKIREIYRLLRNQDSGAAMMLVALSLFLLMGMAAFGTDLAWFYLNASRVQRTADAAALGGVVWLPNNESAAFSTAHSVATQNGYTHDSVSLDTQVLPERVTGELNQLRVTVSDTVPTFFLKVFGFQEQVITRSAVAQYIPPLKLGSPSNKFGNDPSCYSSNTDCAGNFWANIHGTRTDTAYGDAYSSFCNTGNSNTCVQNPSFRPTGYIYGIDPGGSNSVLLEQLDIIYHNDSGGVNNGDPHRTGDHDAHLAGAFPGQTVTVNVYYPDPTPADISDNAIYCSHTYAPLPQVNPDDDPPFDYANRWLALGKGWAAVCGGPINTTSAPNGIWPVQVVTNTGAAPGITFGSGLRITNTANTATSGINQSGLNRYSLRTNTGNLFAIGDFSIYNNVTGSVTSFYLAEVPDFYRGKTFVIEMYDPAEFGGSGTGALQPIDPTTGLPFVPAVNGGCRVYTTAANHPIVWNLKTSVPAGSTCQDTFGANAYNRRWVKFEIDLPVGYTCGSACWWRMNYVYPGGATVNDTTTWRAFMLGNPIHLLR
jgi:hypothetical protein